MSAKADPDSKIISHMSRSMSTVAEKAVKQLAQKDEYDIWPLLLAKNLGELIIL